MNKRIPRVNSLIQEQVGKILLRDFAFSPDVLVTITRVDTSDNLIDAKVFVSVFPETKAGGVLNALTKSVYDVQCKINRTLRMRPIPKIKFVEEKNVREAGRIEELLNEIKEEDKG